VSFFFTGTLLSFFVSVIMNAFLYRELLRVYRELQRVNLDPASFQLFENLPGRSAAEEGLNRIVLFGDSRIQGWMYVPSLRNYEIINRGVGGETTARALLRLKHDVLDLDPDIVVIQIGVNDLKAIGVFPSQESQIIDQCQANLQKMIDTICAAGIHPVVLTIFPTGNVSFFRRPIWSERINVAISKINEWIRTLHSSEVAVVDCDLVLKDMQGVRKEFFTDWLHLNENGYRFLNDVVQLAIEEIMSQPVQQESI
jgi:lysophospholipase L1-like esterase